MRHVLAAALVAAALAPAAAGAQRRTCEVVFVNTPATRQLNIKLPSGKYNTFLGAGVHIKCGQITLKSDSAEIYGDEGRVFLASNVQYDEPRMHLTSDFLNYFQSDERVVAAGRVDARMSNGSSLQGPQAEYRRAVPRVRAIPELSAIARPTLNLKEKAPKGKSQAPTQVTANNLFMLGDSLVYAGGQVEITRPDLTSRSDSAFLNSAREVMQLIGRPALDGRKEKPYRLTGSLIHAWSRNRQLSRVLSMGNANATSQDMTLTSDTIDLRVDADLLQRAVAWGTSRAHAVSSTQDITADSIDVVMPGQKARLMTAIRKAAAEGTPDSAKVHTRERDWLRGDTIVARFDTVQAPGDTSSSPPLRELVARGDARSFYHLSPQDSTAKRPAISYVTGKVIIVTFEQRKLQGVRVMGQTRGVYLEPNVADTTAAPAAARLPAGRPAPRP